VVRCRFLLSGRGFESGGVIAGRWLKGVEEEEECVWVSEGRWKVMRGDVEGSGIESRVLSGLDELWRESGFAAVGFGEVSGWRRFPVAL
jgi:hypothetical protein